MATAKRPCRTALWFREPKKTTVEPAPKKETAKDAGATFALGAGHRGIPLLLDKDQIQKDDSFLEREMKFARRWLYSKGVMMSDEARNPVETSLESFFNDCRTGGRPKANLEIGLADSIAVMLSNMAMDEDRKIHFNEIDKMGLPGAAPAKKIS